jgi:hypothetical protein
LYQDKAKMVEFGKSQEKLFWLLIL